MENNQWLKLALKNKSTIVFVTSLFLFSIATSNLLNKPQNSEQVIQSDPIAVAQEVDPASPQIVDPIESMQATVSNSQASVDMLEEQIVNMVLEQLRMYLVNRAIEWRQFAVKNQQDRGIPASTFLEGQYSTQLQNINNIIATEGNSAAPATVWLELLAIRLANNPDTGLPELGISNLPDVSSTVINNSAISANLKAYEQQFAQLMANTEALQSIINADIQTQINQNSYVPEANPPQQ